MLKSSFLFAAYTEADFEELTYLLQNQLIKRQLAVNKENTILYFTEYLQ